MKILKPNYLTVLDKKLIKTSAQNNFVDVSTKKKRLNIICSDDNGVYKANLYSFAVGIGIGAKSYWQKQEIIFKP
jgi:hypothetical protein